MINIVGFINSLDYNQCLSFRSIICSQKDKSPMVIAALDIVNVRIEELSWENNWSDE